jgi:hypothetical protein
MRAFLAAVMVACVGVSAARADEKPPRPNRVFLPADDLGHAC